MAPETLLPSAAPVRFVAEDGSRADQHGAYAEPAEDRLKSAYRLMVLGRRFDVQATALTKQGRLAVYPSSAGQEACQVAAALALQKHDWLFPTYRDSVALVARGLKPGEVLTLLRGDAHCGYNPAETRVAPQCTPLATQTLHAAGLAHAMQRRGEDAVALALIGDGATSEGDFHEALNFAAVFKAPAVFFVQNNGYAISVPFEKQSAAPALAYKGIGYGMRSEQVDGNDAVAVLAVLDDAVQHAREGHGPGPRRGPHLPHRRPHQRRRRHPLPRRRRSREVARSRPGQAARDLPQDAELLSDHEIEQFRHEAEDFAQTVRDTLERRARARPDVAVRPRLRRADPPAGSAAGHGRSGTGGLMTTTMAQALNAALRDALKDDDRVLVFGEDVGALGGVFRVTDGITADFGEDRCFDTPLAEAGIVGFAVGMAMGGFRPVVEMQFDAFAYPAFEQITSHVAKLRNRTRGALSLPMVIRIPYAGGIGGVEHHCDSSEAYYTHTPGLRVVTPGTAQDAYDLLRDAIESPDPVVFLEPKSRYWSGEEVSFTRSGPAMDKAVVRKTARTSRSSRTARWSPPPWRPPKPRRTRAGTSRSSTCAP